MRILWFVNILLPDLTNFLFKQDSPYGGWMSSLLRGLIEEGWEIGVVSSVDSSEHVGKYKLNNVIYYTYINPNANKYSDYIIDDFDNIIKDFKPDILHLHGSERPYAFQIADKYKESYPIILSIQGLVSECYKRYFDGISFFRLFINLNMIRFISKKSIFTDYRSLMYRASYEIKLLKLPIIVTGRTDWDKAHVISYNPSCSYYKINESLRESFYTSNKWSSLNCKKNTIFISQSSYSIKGLHKVLEAIFLLKLQDIKVEVRIAGADPFSLIKFKRTDYANYLNSLIKKFGIQDQIQFLGELNQLEMVKEYLGANIFVSASSIENSSNSVCEAQYLGTPVISSFVGGVSSLINHGITGLLYPFSDSRLLSYYIKLFLTDLDLAHRVSVSSIDVATLRHNRIVILKDLINLYRKIDEGKIK
jgi:glycosyltransferase involved in cell wall biosynthesis